MMDFKQAEQEFRQLKARFEAKELTEAEFKTRLQDLMVQDEQGSWWMIGYETERWHRHDGTNWVQADPPGDLSQVPVISPEHETTGSKDTERIARMPATSEAAAEAPRVNIGSVRREMSEAQPASRRFPYSLMAAGLVVVVIASIVGYSMLRKQSQQIAPPPGPTKDQVPVAALVEPSTTPSPPPPTAVPSPTPEATATSNPEVSVTIAVSQARLYQGPDLAFGLVVQDLYPLGTTFTVIARDPSGRWFLSRAPDGRVGWLYIDWIDSESDLSLVPTPATLPAPPPTATRKPRNAGPKPTATLG